MRKQLGLPMAVIVAGALAGLVCPASAQTPSAAGAWRTIDDKTGLPRSTVIISEQNGVYRGVVTKGLPGEQARKSLRQMHRRARQRPAHRPAASHRPEARRPVLFRRLPRRSRQRLGLQRQDDAEPGRRRPSTSAALSASRCSAVRKPGSARNKREHPWRSGSAGILGAQAARNFLALRPRGISVALRPRGPGPPPPSTPFPACRRRSAPAPPARRCRATQRSPTLRAALEHHHPVADLEDVVQAVAR